MINFTGDTDAALQCTEPFIWIRSNGGKWYGQQPDSIADLLTVLAEFPLDKTFETISDFITVNPCAGVRNPDYNGTTEPMYIDGKPLFADQTTVSFFGNFAAVSHAFSIFTNDVATIDALTRAIRANQATEGYRTQ